MVRVVPLQLVSKKLASLFANWEGGEGEFEGLFLEGGNGMSFLHFLVKRGVNIIPQQESPSTNPLLQPSLKESWSSSPAHLTKSEIQRVTHSYLQIKPTPRKTQVEDQRRYHPHLPLHFNFLTT